MRGQFFLALVDVTDNAWNGAFIRNDLDVVELSLTHSEGDKPTLDATVKNPQIGLLRPGAHLYAWLSIDAGASAGAEGQFFGRLVGVPSNVLAETVKLTFIADPPDYLKQLQIVAETLKVRPYYDPIFLDQAHRDDPHAILECRSQLYHVDRITNAVTVSDIIYGEDGTVEFDQERVFYDSLSMEMGQSPLTVVEVDATVSWNQHALGEIDLGAETIYSYAGDGILRGWPKAATSLGGGWFVASATAVDTWNIGQALVASWQYSWTNNDKQHNNGDPLSVSASWSVPAVDQAVTGIITSKAQSGVIDPFAVDENGDPAPLNIPMSLQVTTMTVPLWSIDTTLVLSYDTQRQRYERIRFTVSCDLQPLLTYTDASTNAEFISSSGTSVDFSIANVKDWLAVAGQPIAQGQVIFVPQTLVPLEIIANYQVALNAGTAGTSEPSFSPDVGVTTVSGSVTFAGLGPSLIENTADWPKNTLVPLGLVIKPQFLLATVWNQLLPPYPPPLSGASVSNGQIVRTSDGAAYHVAIVGGITDLGEPGWNNTRGGISLSGGVEFQCIGDALPDGTTYWMVTGAGTTNSIVVPPFGSHAAGTTMSDGSVTWTSLGTGGSFIGAPIGDVTRRSYFATDRGLWSIENRIAKARAVLLQRARAVKISWQCPFDLVLSLSCRKNATIFDYRIPGGAATGKVIKYGLRLTDGELVGFVEIGCAIGHGVSVSPAPGTGRYCDIAYVGGAYQELDGVVSALASGDIGYTPPVDSPNDDGLVFPLTKRQVVVVNQNHGNIGAQEDGIRSAMGAAAYAGLLNMNPINSFQASITQQMRIRAASTNSVTVQLARNPIWKDLQLRPVAGQTFSSEFLISTTNLTVPKMIDLEVA